MQNEICCYINKVIQITLHSLPCLRAYISLVSFVGEFDLLSMPGSWLHVDFDDLLHLFGSLSLARTALLVFRNAAACKDK